MVLFLTELFENTNAKTVYMVADARSALKHLFPHCAHVVENSYIKQLIKTFVFAKPSFPKIKDYVWDANIVLDFLSGLPDYPALLLAWHSVKLTLLLLLSTMCRREVLTLLDIENIDFEDDHVTFNFTALTKMQRPSNPVSGGWRAYRTLEVFPYPLNKKLCPVHCLFQYLNNTKYIRALEVSALFISSTPPFLAVRQNTFSGWVKKGLQQAGVDLNQFALHSTRSSAASTAYHYGSSISDLLLRAGWQCPSTFMRHYAHKINPKPGVTVVNVCFFGTRKGREFLQQYHAWDCHMMVKELFSEVWDQNPFRRRRGDPVLLYTTKPSRFTKNKTKKLDILSNILSSARYNAVPEGEKHPPSSAPSAKWSKSKSDSTVVVPESPQRPLSTNVFELVQRLKNAADDSARAPSTHKPSFSAFFAPQEQVPAVADSGSEMDGYVDTSGVMRNLKLQMKPVVCLTPLCITSVQAPVSTDDECLQTVELSQQPNAVSTEQLPELQSGG